MKPICKDNSLWNFEIFDQFQDVTDFTTSRHGGFSKGNYASFNPSPYSGDNAETVEKNLQKLMNTLPQKPEHLFRPRQVHDIVARPINREFLSLSEPWQTKCLEGVDALMTDLQGCCICVSTADCIPILLYDSHNKAVAAVHAGWRGTVKCILLNTLQQMHELYRTEASDVYAAIGPGISLQAFEVGDEVYQAFNDAHFDMDKISMFNEKTQKYHIDLWKANRMQLNLFGLTEDHIEESGICTYTRHNDFFSARRLGIESGRILTGIMINKE